MKRTLKEWRELRYMTQEELGEAIGKTNMTISLWETGKSEPKLSDLINMAQVLRTGGIHNIILPKR